MGSYRISAASLQEIARKTQISMKAVQLLLGSLKISTTASSPENERIINYDIGLRLLNTSVGSQLSESVLKQGFSKLLDEYNRVCPSIVAWVCRGDFSVDKIPAQIKSETLLHASRTAGRLRASFIRKIDTIERSVN